MDIFAENPADMFPENNHAESGDDVLASMFPEIETTGYRLPPKRKSKTQNVKTKTFKTKKEHRQPKGGMGGRHDIR